MAKFRDTLYSFLTIHGRVDDPLEYLCDKLSVAKTTISPDLKFAERGIGSGTDEKLSPTKAYALIAISEMVIRESGQPLAENPVRDYLEKRLAEYYESKSKSKIKRKKK